MKRILVSAGLVRGAAGRPEAGRILLTRRPPDAHLGDWWEFPGGKVEPGESPVEALVRELREELGVDVAVGDIYAVGHHVYESRDVVLLIYECEIVEGEPACIEVAELRWLTVRELLEVPLPPADEPVVERLRREL